MTTIFEMTEQNMADNSYDAAAYLREQWLNSFFAPERYIVTESGSGDEVISEDEMINEPDQIAQPSSKRTYTPEQQAKRNEQRRARRAAGKAN